MSGCPCGGPLVTRRERGSAGVLTWRACWSCGRCGHYLLTEGGAVVAEGEDARLMAVRPQSDSPTAVRRRSDSPTTGAA